MMAPEEPERKDAPGQPRIWTIGHSVRPIEEFLDLLGENGIKLLVDVRLLPGSRRHPQFNSEALARSVRERNIEYLHLPELGGRRRARPDSPNIAWRNESFRGYADYMETRDFQVGLARLEGEAKAWPTAVMCAEQLWWRCHRSMIADALKVRGWVVLHIERKGKAPAEHPYTSAAMVVAGRLSYRSGARAEETGGELFAPAT
jgi:uncharacterized protein (DUF488 family)